jgi:glycosyltransferase involved in cell wall biosynthesis
VVIAAPLFEKAAFLRAAIESILAQTYRTFTLLLVDDASSDETSAIADEYARSDPRVTYVQNERRMGLLGNWRQCFELARRWYPGSPYFAWGSDHDVWETEWLEALVAALDGSPEIVLAYPLHEVIDEGGTVIHRDPSEGRERGLDTVGIESPRTRLRMTVTGMRAGSMVYGLFRADVIEKAGVFRSVIGPDRLLIVEAAMRGQFRLVDQVLWRRRFRGLYSAGRQRRALFLDRPPLYSYLSPSLVHGVAIAWLYVGRGAGLPEIPRRKAIPLAWQFGASILLQRMRRRAGRLAKGARRRRKQLRSRLLRVGSLLRALIRPPQGRSGS